MGQEVDEVVQEALGVESLDKGLGNMDELYVRTLVRGAIGKFLESQGGSESGVDENDKPVMKDVRALSRTIIDLAQAGQKPFLVTVPPVPEGF